MAKDIKDLQTADLTGKRITFLVVSLKYVRKARFDSLWDKFLPLARPIGGFRRESRWHDFKDNDASELIDWLNDNNFEILAVNLR